MDGQDEVFGIYIEMQEMPNGVPVAAAEPVFPPPDAQQLECIKNRLIFLLKFTRFKIIFIGLKIMLTIMYLLDVQYVRMLAYLIPFHLMGLAYNIIEAQHLSDKYQ
jgi:hypothetical protein